MRVEARLKRLITGNPSEVPSSFGQALRVGAETVRGSTEDTFVDNMINFKQALSVFMARFDLQEHDFKAYRVDKRRERGGFTKRAIQDHPDLGVGGLRLVRDKLSGDRFLPQDEQGKELYFLLLLRKLEEEAGELADATNRDERRKELADVTEVFDTILAVTGVDPFIVEELRRVREVEQRRTNRKKK